jgi:3-hydroxymyristoyl/3-hydroxydecanoyl-(acyl carrier protein) dehydratase
VSSAQIGTAFWQAPEISPKVRRIDVPESSLAKPLLYSDFRQRTSLSAIEILALSRGTLVADAPYEVAQLPSDQMLEVGRIEHISGSIASGEGEIEASRDNSPLNWFYPMTPGVKPAALSIDAVWQLIGVFQAWGGSAGTGRALGLERVEVFDEIRPEDRDVRYEVKVVKTIRSEQTGDAFVRADAMVFADGRPIMSVTNANVGCHKDIRYLDYPMSSEMAFGGKLKTRKD